MVMVPETSREAPGPDAPPHGGIGGGLAHARVIGQAQVVVGAQQEHRLAIEQHVRPLRAGDETGAAHEPEGFQLIKPCLDLDHGYAT